MAKESKKAKQERNELDIILEQLKKSYSSESSEAVKELTNSETEDTDEELASLLGKVFMKENDISPNVESGSYANIDIIDNDVTETIIAKDEIVEDKIVEDEIVEDEIVEDEIVEDEIVEDEIVEDEIVEDEIVEDEIVEDEIVEDEIVEDEIVEDDLCAKNEVDDVLNIMLRRTPATDNVNHAEQEIDDSSNEVTNEKNIVDNNILTPLTYDNEDKLEKIDEDDFFIEDDIIEDDIVIKDSDCVEEDDNVTYNEDFAVVDEEYEPKSNADEELAETVITVQATEAQAKDISSETALPLTSDTEQCSVSISDEPEVEIEQPVLILSPDEYISDPLQEQLSGLGFGSDLNADSMFSDDQVASVISDTNESFDINDISLLLKFGYEDEVKTQFGDESTHDMVLEKNNVFIPEAHKIPFGYRGKEFVHRDQISGIRAKYKADKRSILIRLFAVSAIALMVLATNVFFEFFSDRTSYPVVLALELMLLLLIGLILYKQLYIGAIGILRFEAGPYSILLLVLSCCCVYDIAAMILYVINAASIIRTELMIFGFTGAAYSILTIITDLINCVKEADVFDIISSSEELYVAEKQSSKSMSSFRGDTSEKFRSKGYLSSNEHAYKIRKASMISGYFKKTAQSGASSINLIYIIGVVPILSLLVGCVCTLSSGNMLRGASAILITALLCMPFSLIVFNPVSEYILASKLKHKKIAFVGSESVEEYATTDTVIFSDADAVEISSYTEIQPSKNANMKRYIATAYEVFEALKGPLSQYKLNISEEKSHVIKKPDLIINEINESGINIYFNSSMNILMGDRGYMKAHGINVKTDPNLSTATKGADCAVIYMAFDGVPRLGFIINSIPKRDFLDAVLSLDKEAVKVFVESYEPQINDLFFEHNKGNSKAVIGVHKPSEYEGSDSRQICESGIISASSATSLAKAIKDSRRIIEQRTRIKRTHFILVACGFVIACLLSLLLGVHDSVPVLGALKSHESLIFNLLMIAELIPAVINLIKLNTNHTSGDNNE